MDALAAQLRDSVDAAEAGPKSSLQTVAALVASALGIDQLLQVVLGDGSIEAHAVPSGAKTASR